MGFDQYHEPPEELAAATRTFARLCASLTEEAEAIGWYQQRLAVETDPEAIAVMRDAQGEEFKHFSMDLELLLRRTPPWREVAAGHPLPARRRRRARRGGRGGGLRGRRQRSRRRLRGRLARDRRPEGGGTMNHLLREQAPLSDAGWKLLDDEARERLAPALGARKLVDFSGPHGWEHSASTLGRVRKLRGGPSKAVSGLQREVLPLVELRADFALSREELRDADRGAPDADLGAARRRGAARSRWRRTSRSSTAGRARSPESPSASPYKPVAARQIG